MESAPIDSYGAAEERMLISGGVSLFTTQQLYIAIASGYRFRRVELVNSREGESYKMLIDESDLVISVHVISIAYSFYGSWLERS